MTGNLKPDCKGLQGSQWWEGLSDGRTAGRADVVITAEEWRGTKMRVQQSEVEAELKVKMQLLSNDQQACTIAMDSQVVLDINLYKKPENEDYSSPVTRVWTLPVER